MRLKLELSDKLITDIQQNVFGPCTVVYEAMTKEEIATDIEAYLKEGALKKLPDGSYAHYIQSLTITTLKRWLKLRMDVELADANPETPFDRSDEEIRKAIAREKDLKKRLTASIRRFTDRLKEQVNV
jgi:hypothetical protein